MYQYLTVTAGCTKEDLDGSNTSVYVGSFVKGMCCVHFWFTSLPTAYKMKIMNRFAFGTRTGSLNMPRRATESP